MRVIVMSRKDAVRYSFGPHEEETAVVSISTPFQQYGAGIYKSRYNGIHSILRLEFDDVDCGEEAITEFDAMRIKGYVEANKEKTIIIHCDAGVSRSAGIAAALMKHYNGDDSEIFDNPRYVPNMLCYRIMLNVLEGIE